MSEIDETSPTPEAAPQAPDAASTPDTPAQPAPENNQPAPENNQPATPPELGRAVALPSAQAMAEMPAGWAKSLLFIRAGVSPKDPLCEGLTDTHASCRGPQVLMVPKGFQWPEPAPETLGEALAAIDAVAALAPPVKATDAPKAVNASDAPKAD